MCTAYNVTETLEHFLYDFDRVSVTKDRLQNEVEEFREENTQDRERYVSNNI